MQGPSRKSSPAPRPSRVNVTLSTKISSAFVAATLIIVVAMMAFQSIATARDARRREGLSHEVSHALAQMSAALVLAESSQRGYLLTRDARFLAPYERAIESGQRRLARLHALTRDDPVERASLRGLDPLVLRNVAQMNAALEAHRRGDGAEALRMLSTDGQETVAELQALTDAIGAAEQRTLRGQREVIDRQLGLASTVIVLGSALAFVILVSLNFSIRREVVAREQDRALIQDQKASLEAQARELMGSQRSLTEQVEKQQAQATELERVNRELDAEMREREGLIVALTRSNHELDQFAYVASHDLKAPLRGIASLADWIREDLGAAVTPGAAENLKLLFGRVHRMEALIEGILTYSRAARVKEGPVRVDTAAMLAELIELMAPPEGIFVRVEGPMPEVVCERVPFQQVWMNLVGNAIKHGGSGDVVLRSKDLGTHWEFSVQDHGPGIAAQYHDRIFGIFQTLSSRDQVEGTGIGLAIVKKIVESRGGKVSVESAPGEGSTFAFTWAKKHSVPESAHITSRRAS